MGEEFDVTRDETVITRRNKAQMAICRHPIGMPKRKQALRMRAMGASDDEN
jgi:hypothetical protein